MGTKSTVAVEETVVLPSVQIMLGFKHYPEKTFEPFMDKVIKCTTDNPYKTVTPALLANCVLKRNQYVAARTNRDANPSPANTQFLESANMLAAKAFEELANWVQANCDDDPAIALSFGFKIAKPNRTSATLLPAPSNVKNKYGMPGTIVFKCNALGPNVKYMVECSLDNGITWTVCGISTKSFRIIASGLVRGKEYIFRISGVNNAGNGYPWTSAGIIAAV